MKEPTIKQEWVDQRLEDLRNRLMTIKEQEAGRGISAKKQAEKMDLSESNLTKYTKSKTAYTDEGKKPPVMGVDKLIRICQYYDVSADYLLGLTSDKKLMRRHIPSEAAIKDMCDYTGLTRQAIEALHERKEDFLFSAGLTYLLTSRKNLLSNIIEYILDRLRDIVAEDDRYSMLPGVGSSDVGKYFFYDVIEGLPQARDSFYHLVMNNEIWRERYAKEMAMKCVDHKKVFFDLFPYISYSEDLSPDECAKLNDEVMKEITSEEYSIQVPGRMTYLPQQGADEIDATPSKEQVLYDNQCEAFWDDYYLRVNK